MKLLNQYVVIRAFSLLLLPVCYAVNQEVWTELSSLQKYLARRVPPSLPSLDALREMFDFYEQQYIDAYNNGKRKRSIQQVEALAEFIANLLIASHERGERPPVDVLAQRIFTHFLVEQGAKPAKTSAQSN